MNPAFSVFDSSCASWQLDTRYILRSNFVPFLSFPRFMALITRGELVYREIIPLRAAVEDLDTYQNSLHRATRQYADIFVKIMRGSHQKGAVMICYLNNLAVNSVSNSSSGAFPLLQLLIQSCHRRCPDSDEVRFF
jgi:hypothetical protein